MGSQQESPQLHSQVCLSYSLPSILTPLHAQPVYSFGSSQPIAQGSNFDPNEAEVPYHTTAEGSTTSTLLKALFGSPPPSPPPSPSNPHLCVIEALTSSVNGLKDDVSTLSSNLQAYQTSTNQTLAFLSQQIHNIYSLLSSQSQTTPSSQTQLSIYTPLISPQPPLDSNLQTLLHKLLNAISLNNSFMETTHSTLQKLQPLPLQDLLKVGRDIESMTLTQLGRTANVHETLNRRLGNPNTEPDPFPTISYMCKQILLHLEKLPLPTSQPPSQPATQPPPPKHIPSSFIPLITPSPTQPIATSSSPPKQSKGEAPAHKVQLVKPTHFFPTPPKGSDDDKKGESISRSPIKGRTKKSARKTLLRIGQPSQGESIPSQPIQGENTDSEDDSMPIVFKRKRKRNLFNPSSSSSSPNKSSLSSSCLFIHAQRKGKDSR